MVGDLWYGVATQGMTEGRHPGFEPPICRGKKKMLKGESSRGKKKMLKGESKWEKLKGECKSAKVQTN
jgi:hypothetical protein